MVIKVHKVRLVIKDILEQLESAVHLVHLVKLALKGHKEKLVVLDQE